MSPELGAQPPLSILQVITTTDVGGAEHHLLDLCAGLVARGHRVDVAYLKGADTMGPKFSAIGVTPRSAAMPRWAGQLGALPGLIALCRRGDYDVVHTHLLKANFLGAIAARLSGVPVVVASKHNDEPQLCRAWVAALHRLGSRLEDRVLYASQHIARFMESVGRLPSARGETVLYGIATEPESAPSGEMRRELGLEPSAFVVVCVARLVRRKGHTTLLRAFRRFVAGGEADARLLIVGKGPMEVELRQLASELGLTDHVLFAGERLDVRRLLPEMDLFVLASDQEGLGLVLLEAMACGLPVVATRVGGMPEIVADMETGLLVPSGDPEALAAALRAISSDRPQGRGMGERGRARAGAEFGLETMVDAVERVYRRALAARAGAAPLVHSDAPAAGASTRSEASGGTPR